MGTIAKAQALMRQAALLLQPLADAGWDTEPAIEALWQAQSKAARHHDQLGAWSTLVCVDCGNPHGAPHRLVTCVREHYVLRSSS